MITVMTAVFNRKDLMERLFISLKQQTDKDFEWLIIDDGSTDDLSIIVEEWINATKDFPIRYYIKENGGKHRAWNMGINLANGDFTFVVDSDDYLQNKAIEIIKTWIKEIETNQHYAGVSGCKAYYDGEGQIHIYGTYPENVSYVDSSNLNRHHPSLLGDKAEVYRTDILRKYPFPEFEGEKFCTEDVVFHRIARDGYILRWFPEPIYIAEYLDGGLTKNVIKQRMSYIQGYTYSVKNGGKYDQFPYNHLNVGEYLYTLKQNGVSIGEAAKRIEISAWEIAVSTFWYKVQQIRRGILNKIEKNE